MLPGWSRSAHVSASCERPLVSPKTNLHVDLGLDARVIRFIESGSREVGISKLWSLSQGLERPVEELVRDL
jgi:hypothetical protein